MAHDQYRTAQIRQTNESDVAYRKAQREFIAASGLLADSFIDGMSMSGLYTLCASIILSGALVYASLIQAHASQVQAQATLQLIDLQRQDIAARRAAEKVATNPSRPSASQTHHPKETGIAR